VAGTGARPVTGVGPGALADLRGVVDELAVCGIETRVETEVLGFDFSDLTAAWEGLAGVTAVGLPGPWRQLEVGGEDLRGPRRRSTGPVTAVGGPGPVLPP
jgi:hypothetical protein